MSCFFFFASESIDDGLKSSARLALSCLQLLTGPFPDDPFFPDITRPSFGKHSLYPDITRPSFGKHSLYNNFALLCRKIATIGRTPASRRIPGTPRVGRLGL
jgi:hypothetical protein